MASMPPLGSQPVQGIKRSGYLSHPDEASLDTPAIHFRERHRYWIVGIEMLLGHVFEHVFDGEAELLPRLSVLGLAGDEGIRLVHVAVGETDQGVDDADA
jgi:hypothetical protein